VPFSEIEYEQMSNDQPLHEFLSQLQRLQPATVKELCDALGVTATAIRQRLLKCQSDGWIDRSTARQGRGRPRHEYRLTDDGLRQLGDDYAEIAAILWRQVMLVDDRAVRNQILSGVKSSLIQRFGDQTPETSLVGRIQSLASQLSQSGFDVELKTNPDPNGLPILVEHNCPYHELAQEDTTICDIEQSVYSELIGVPVTLSSCRQDGKSCCEFQIGVSD